MAEDVEDIVLNLVLRDWLKRDEPLKVPLDELIRVTKAFREVKLNSFNLIDWVFFEKLNEAFKIPWTPLETPRLVN